METYEAVPEGQTRAGVVVLPTVRGLNDFIPLACQRLAAAGFRVVAPNLHHRVRAEPLRYDEDYRSVLDALTEQGLLEDIDASIEHLISKGVHDGNVSVVGFALGGSAAHTQEVA